LTSFCGSTSPARIFCKNGFDIWREHATKAGYGLTAIVSRNEITLAQVEKEFSGLSCDPPKATVTDDISARPDLMQIKMR
jgi:hypothetical protein